MKTSNKILSGTFFTLLGCVFIFMLYFKSNSKPLSVIEGMDPKHPVKQVREISEFERVEANSSGIVVKYSQGPPSLKVIADQRVIENVLTSVDAGKFYVGLRPGNYHNIGRIMAIVSSENLTEIEMYNSSRFTTDGTINVDEINIAAYNSSQIVASINADQMTISSNNGAKIRLEGTANSAEAFAQNSGNIEAINLTVGDLEVKATQSGYIGIGVAGTLKAEAMHSGNIEYKGDPEVIKEVAQHSGSIRKL